MKSIINKPEISIVMPVYNEAKYLGESINSILNQTFDDFELIIINDCSTDDSARIIRNYGDKRIVSIDNEINQGFPKSINIGLKLARGKYIAILDGDDVAINNRLELQYNYLNHHLYIFLVGSSAIYIDGDGNEIKKFRKYDDYEMLAWRLKKSCSIIHPSVMFRNEGFLFNPYFKGASDYRFYLELLSAGKHLTNLPQFLVKYRLHKDSMSISNKEEQERLSNEAREKINFVSKFKLRFLFKLFIHYIRTYKEKR